MKTTIIATLICCLLSFSNFSQSNDSNIKIGDTFVIGKAEMNNYKHIQFPRNNFIIKKGGIATYKNIVNKKVEITSIKEKSDGNLEATIKLKSGKYFFKSHKYIKVNLEKAIKAKELISN